MQLTPVYGGVPILRVEGLGGDPGVPMLRQRRRLGALLQGLDPDQWAAQSRCDGWSVQDVVSHLASTNRFWAISIGAGRRSEPTTFLATFDPVSSPDELVAASRDRSTADVLAEYLEGTEAIAAALEGMRADDWKLAAEAPPGHIGIGEVVLHAMWDSWIHERDIALPLGLDQPIERDEVDGSLRYVAALSPAFAASQGSTRSGSLAFSCTGPPSTFVVDIDTRVVVHDGPPPADAVPITGNAVDVLEALSYRGPHHIEVPKEADWMMGGLGAVFDRS